LIGTGSILLTDPHKLKVVSVGGPGPFTGHEVVGLALDHGARVSTAEDMGAARCSTRTARSTRAAITFQVVVTPPTAGTPSASQ